MSHTDLILVVTISFASTLGSIYVIIKTINKFTQPSNNVLTRRGDIELVDFNEPTQPLQAYLPEAFLPREGEVLSQQYTISENIQIGNINSHYPDYFITNVNSQYPDIIFRYYNSLNSENNELERYYINSCLENEIIFNIEFIPIIIFIIIILLVIFISDSNYNIFTRFKSCTFNVLPPFH